MRWMECASLLFLCACAHGPKRASPDALKPAAEQFNEKIRWRDFPAAVDFLVPERREAFRAERAKNKDERDLSFTDCELEKLVVAPDGSSAQVTSLLKWVKLPSTVEQEAHVVSEYVDYRGTWLLARQQGGPFVELEAVYEGVPDSGS